MEAARPTQTVDTAGRMWRMVSNTAMPAPRHACSVSGCRQRGWQSVLVNAALFRSQIPTLCREEYLTQCCPGGNR